MWLIVLIVMLAVGLFFLYRGRAFPAWAVPVAIWLVVWRVSGHLPFLFWVTATVFVALAVLFGIPTIRQRLVTPPLMRAMAGYLPRISDTEKLALEAGTVWWDGDLFSGRPNWSKLLDFEPRPLSAEEQAFLDGPVTELCGMIDDWEAHRTGDLPAAVWDYMKSHGFFGMIIPTEHGGLGFSAAAHSAVITRIGSRSVAGAVTVMVPNSLGPAELLLHYGTEDQKRHYLPRLARGEEIPCFALTEPAAGSDAASGKSRGRVCRGVFDGEEVLGMRLDWEKRYATLAPVATVIGLAFTLHDPEHLLGEVENLGITCALIPADLPGVETGRRHDPLGVPFLNGPTTGTDVFVPLDFIIGGPEMAGQGWRMLMESLAAGRSISLPALSAGAAEVSARVTGAYATVREQFNVPIAAFEGIEERLTRIGGLTYLMNAARGLTAAAVDAGEKPSVLSALMKAYMTEFMRIAVNDGMDVLGGAGISRGHRNMLAAGYMALPIGITVEGANILSRSLIIFGQGAIRCHPYVLEEIHAVETHDLGRFDRALFGHMGFVLSNCFRAWVLGLTGSRPARPRRRGPLEDYVAELSRMSAAFTFMADVTMAVLGGALKRKEMLSGRMADALAWMYFGSAVIKRFEDEGRPAADLPFARWGLTKALYEIETALSEFLRNFPSPWVRRFVRWSIFPLGTHHHPPNDRLRREVASALVFGGEGRLRLTPDMYIPPPEEPGLGFLEAALAKVLRARPLERKLHEAVRRGRLARADRPALVKAGLASGVITEEEARWVLEAEAARNEVIQVDDFGPEYFGAEVFTGESRASAKS
jgi:acyl-CoA dehydrogenase